MLQVRENEISLRELSGSIAQSRSSEGTLIVKFNQIEGYSPTVPLSSREKTSTSPQGFAKAHLCLKHQQCS